MGAALEKLLKILRLEESMGYQNRAVIGGLEKFAPHWREEALAAATTDGARTDIAGIYDALSRYGNLSSEEERKEAISSLIQRIQALPASAPSTAVPQAPSVNHDQAAIPTETEVPALDMSGESLEEPTMEAAETTAGAPHLPPSEEEDHIPPIHKPSPSQEKPAPPQPPAERHGLDAPVTTLPKIGPVQSKRLDKLGIRTVRDLLWYFPRRYDDYSMLKTIHELRPGEDVTIMGNIRQVSRRQLDGRRTLLKCIISDGTGQLELTWFNQPYLEKRLLPGRAIVVSGRVDQFLGRLTMNAPEWEPLDKEQIHTGRLVPVYPLTQGITSRWIRRLIRRALDYWADRIQDYLPDELRERVGLVDLGTALREIHFPQNEESLAAARARFAFEELFFLQIGIVRLRQEWRSQRGEPLTIDRAALDAFLAALPFSLTGAQQRALEEILQDLAQPVPMNRLLQGDVGSGKTVIAAAAAVAAVRSQFQVAIMAPTEILASQHFARFTELMQGVRVPADGGERPVAVRLLVGSMSAGEKERVYAELAEGVADIVVGTHALLQEAVQFKRLGLVVIDEQHRFGVTQRSALRQKGYSPHVLVMTATPIPRTLSLTLYGDLDLSIIDELPPGRQPIQTYIVTRHERERAYQFIRAQVSAGHQAFIICPLVEESDSIDAPAAVAEYQRLSTEVFPTLRLGLLHGRMRSEEKEEVMRQFQAGQLDILVSTAVVEVGIDIPNATVMLIEGADRFGLAQLHQFRGRVGRGKAPSYCLLVAENAGEEGMERLRAVAESQDGFALAEKDLHMRGPGEFLGTRQSGLPALRMAHLLDIRLLDQARREAQHLLELDPTLGRPEHAELAQRVDAAWQRQETDIS